MLASEQPPAQMDFTKFIAAIATDDHRQLLASIANFPKFVTLRDSTEEGWAAIHHAAALGNFEAVTFLLDAGCSPNLGSGEFIKDGDDDNEGYHDPGECPITVATWKDQLAVIKLLLARGADPTGADCFSHSAVHVAAMHQRLSILNVLIAHGADTNLSSNRRHFDEELDWHYALSPLHVAAQADAEEVARCLLAHGAQLNACTLDKRTPLFYAAARGSAGVARVLLEGGADPNARESREGYGMCLDYTPLHYAAKNGHAGTVKVLLDFGADASARECSHKKTALQLARAEGHRSVMAALGARR